MIESPGCVSSFLGRRTSMRNLFSAKRGERFAGEAVDGPFGVRPRPQALVETDRFAVPVEHRPFEPAALALDRQPSQLLEERAPDTAAAMLRRHEQVFQVNPRLAQEGQKFVKKEGNPDGRAIHFSDQRLRVVVRCPEEVGREPLLGHRDLVLQLFIARESADQLSDERNVRRLALPDDQRHLGRSLSRKTRRIAPCVSEKLAILLSTKPAASPASMTSVSRISERLPFGRTTQMAPLGSIQDLTSLMRFKSRSSRAPMKTRSQSLRGRPWTISGVRARSCAKNPGSSRSTIATLEPGLTPRLPTRGRVE